MTMDKRIDEILERFALATAVVERDIRHRIDTSPEDLSPLVFMFRDKDGLQWPPRVLLDTGLLTPAHKEYVRPWLENLLSQNEADGYFLITEAWAVETADPEQVKDIQELGVNNVPGHRDIANILCVLRDPKEKEILCIQISMCDIVRIDENTRIGGHWYMISNNVYEGNPFDRLQSKFLVTQWA